MRCASPLQPLALERFFSWRADVDGPLGGQLRNATFRLLEKHLDLNL